MKPFSERINNPMLEEKKQLAFLIAKIFTQNPNFLFSYPRFAYLSLEILMSDTKTSVSEKEDLANSLAQPYAPAYDDRVPQPFFTHPSQQVTVAVNPYEYQQPTIIAPDSSNHEVIERNAAQERKKNARYAFVSFCFSILTPIHCMVLFYWIHKSQREKDEFAWCMLFAGITDLVLTIAAAAVVFNTARLKMLEVCTYTSVGTVFSVFSVVVYMCACLMPFLVFFESMRDLYNNLVTAMVLGCISLGCRSLAAVFVYRISRNAKRVKAFGTA